MSNTDIHYENEFYSRLMESLDAIDASCKAMEDRILKLEKFQQAEKDWSTPQGTKIQKSTSLLLVDDFGVEHSLPQTAFIHQALIRKEPIQGFSQRGFPLPTSIYPCLRAFAGTFPGVCVDFRAEGQLPRKMIQPYNKMGQQEILSADNFLKLLRKLLESGKITQLGAVTFGDTGRLSIQITTYQY